MSFEPPGLRQLLAAASESLKAMVRQAFLLPEPFVRDAEGARPSNIDSIGFVVRTCLQCSAGKS